MQEQNWKRRINALLAAATIALIAGCNSNNENNAETASAPQNAGDGATKKTITIGYLPNIVLPQPLLGIQNGEFAKAVPGVTFVGKDYPAGPEVLEALRAGVVDIAYTGPYPPIKAYAKSKDVVLLAGAASGGTELMVAKNAPYKTVKDLKGKAIGINQLGSTVDAMVRHKLIEAGLNPDKDVRLIEVKPAEQADAIKRNEVAAVAAPAPWPSVVKINGNGRPLLDWKQILDNGDYLAGVCFTTKQFAEANPDLVKQFVAAHRAITDRLNQDRAKGHAEVLSAWSKVTKKQLKPEVARAAFATIEFTNDADQKGFERAQDIAVEVGILRQKGDLTGFVYQP